MYFCYVGRTNDQPRRIINASGQCLIRTTRSWTCEGLAMACVKNDDSKITWNSNAMKRGTWSVNRQKKLWWVPLVGI